MSLSYHFPSVNPQNRKNLTLKDLEVRFHSGPSLLLSVIRFDYCLVYRLKIHPAKYEERFALSNRFLLVPLPRVCREEVWHEESWCRQSRLGFLTSVL